jgi:hypothetical protein
MPVKPKLIDLILEFQYGKLFGQAGIVVITVSIIIFLIVKFLVGINTVILNPKTCKISNWDVAYLIFHKQQILRNTSLVFQSSLRENQVVLRHINDGVNPFKSSTDGNITRARKIKKSKFMWKSMAKRLTKENLAIIKCLAKLPKYKF